MFRSKVTFFTKLTNSSSEIFKQLKITGERQNLSKTRRAIRTANKWKVLSKSEWLFLIMVKYNKNCKSRFFLTGITSDVARKVLTAF